VSRALLAIAVVLAISIAVILILPSFDVLPTAMRASRHAQTFFNSLALMATAVAEMCIVGFVVQPPKWDARSADILNVTCALLC
jgi:hypothetical protein